MNMITENIIFYRIMPYLHCSIYYINFYTLDSLQTFLYYPASRASFTLYLIVQRKKPLWKSCIFSFGVHSFRLDPSIKIWLTQSLIIICTCKILDLKQSKEALWGLSNTYFEVLIFFSIFLIKLHCIHWLGIISGEDDASY